MDGAPRRGRRVRVQSPPGSEQAPAPAGALRARGPCAETDRTAPTRADADAAGAGILAVAPAPLASRVMAPAPHPAPSTPCNGGTERRQRARIARRIQPGRSLEPA